MSKDEKTYYYATFEFIEKTEMTVTSLTGLDNFYKQLEKVFISYYKCGVTVYVVKTVHFKKNRQKKAKSKKGVKNKTWVYIDICF